MTTCTAARAAAAAAAVAVSAIPFVIPPASAAPRPKFEQSFGAGSYHASHDFVPSSSTIHVGGRGCYGGPARSFYVKVMRTRDKAGIFSSGSWFADGVTQTDKRPVRVDIGTSYYLRWYGKDNGGNDASAPCAYVFANW